MEQENKTTQAAVEEKTTDTATKPEATKKTTRAPRDTKRGARPGARRGQRRGGRKERPKPDVAQKIISIRRVTRVMAGGRRFSFSVAMAVGDGKGKIGVGTGKSNDTSLAIAKAFRAAKENMVQIATTDDMSIRHEVTAKYKASEVFLMPNKERGIVAGGALRDMLNLGGFKNVTAKIHSRSKNHLNNAKATIDALKKLTK
jgi:small subunit ribosomal protein S5